MHLQTITIFTLTLLGFALRLRYLTTTHPFFDEYTSVLAARQILQEGWPILPSGLFYEHGLLSTYLMTPFTALFIDMPKAHWQPAHWGLMLSRWPSLLIGTVTIPLIYSLGRRANHLSSVSLFAAGLFALSPEGMVWGGRARMYALATLFVLLTSYWAYRGAVYPAPAKYRWLAMTMLLATLLTQFGAMMLVPTLIISMVVIGWLSWRNTAKSHASPRITHHAFQVWFFRPAILLEGTALVAIIGLAILVKRLGRPIGTATLNDTGSSGLVTNLLNTITYQTTFYFTWPDTVKFLSRQFGVTHHYWLTLIAITGFSIALIFWFAQKKPVISKTSFITFLTLIFGLIISEMITLLQPFRRNPRYMVMYLPFFYLIVAQAIFNIQHLPQLITRIIPGTANLAVSRFIPSAYHQPIITIILLALFTAIGYNDLYIALITPEPAYEEAFAHIYTHQQPGDTVLTMNTPAAELYLDNVDGFTLQSHQAADQFLLNADSAPIDRWLGVPWLGTVTAFNGALNTSPQTWFVIDTIRLASTNPFYFRGNWLAIVNTQMEQVWANDNAIVYRTRPNRIPLPTQPDTLINATLGDSIQLVGYTLQAPNSQSSVNEASLQLTLFWQALTQPPINYTIFFHLRNSDGTTIVQNDSQPLNGTYPTSHWYPAETIIHPITLSLPEDIPAGTYTLFTGLYQLDTLERLPVANDTSGENAILLGEAHLP